MNSIATLSSVLENKDVGLFASLHDGLPEGSIAEKIYKLRKINGLGLEAFAKRIGMSVTAIKSWEVEGILPSQRSLEKICTAFTLDMTYFECSSH
jgi:DNA-binding transcriptional regulator YiaG